MLYGNESISHYTPSNVTIWMAMAFQAGILNTGGFLVCHRFVSHVTGFATFFGIEVSHNESMAALGMLAVPLFFLFGAMISGQLVDIPLKLRHRPRYYLAFAAVFFLIFVVFMGGMLNYFGVFGDPLDRPREYFLLALLCLACGIQNGTITTVSKSVIRTTHLTGITTDLGIGIMRILNRSQLPGRAEGEGRANLMRAGIIFCFGMGAVIGVFLFDRYEYGGFILPLLTSGGLCGTMYYYQACR